MKLCQRQVAVYQSTTGPKLPETMTSMSNMTHALRSMGQHDDAVQQLRQSLQLQQEVLGPEHPDTLTSMGQHEEAARLHRQTPQLRQKMSGPDRPLASTNDSASALQDLRRSHLAQDLWRAIPQSHAESICAAALVLALGCAALVRRRIRRL